jgi:hypothetical protein
MTTKHEPERPRLTALGLTLEDMQNDADALAVLVRLADWMMHPTGAASACRAAVLENGAGGIEASAVLAWVRARLTETENSIAAADGSGMPGAVVVVEVRGGVAEVSECPPGIEVRITDWDNEPNGPEGD